MVSATFTMKKFLILLLMLGASFFALKKWSPDTLRKITQPVSYTHLTLPTIYSV